METPERELIRHEYFHTVSELDSVAAVERMKLFAEHILKLAIDNAGKIGDEEATAQVSRELGTTVSEVRTGIIYGEGTRMFHKSFDGSTLIATVTTMTK